METYPLPPSHLLNRDLCPSLRRPNLSPSPSLSYCLQRITLPSLSVLFVIMKLYPQMYYFIGLQDFFSSSKDVSYIITYKIHYHNDNISLCYHTYIICYINVYFLQNFKQLIFNDSMFYLLKCSSYFILFIFIFLNN